MKLLLRSLKPIQYESEIRCVSRALAGVSYTIRRISLGRRIEIAEAIRDLAQELEFQQAGGTPGEKVQAAVLSARIDQVYLRWGLTKISGLVIDGQPATAETLFASGPEGLLHEIVARIKAEYGLTDDERKN
jgi:hypothetical protein